MALAGKTVVVLRTSSVARIPVYEHLRSLGLCMILVHPFHNSNFDGLFDHWLQHDTNDVDALFAFLTTRLAELRIVPDAVISFDEYAVYPAALIAERLGKRPIPMPSAAMRTTNVKSKFREFCYQVGLNAPRSKALHSRDVDAAAELSSLEFPIVLKPSPGAGSLLAKCCDTLADALDYLPRMWDVLDSHPDVKHFRALNAPVHVLAEEYIGGQEVDVDCAIWNGEIKWAQVSDNFETTPPFFVERGGLTPSALPPHKQEAVLDLLRIFVRAQGPAIHGVLHFEAKYDHARGAAYVIEVNCRLGSAETNTMLSTVFGIELGECLVRCALNMPLDNLFPGCDRPRTYCASVNIYPAKAGVLRSYHVPEEDESLVRYSVSQQPGNKVSPPPKTFFLLAWLVCQGANPEEAIANVQRCTRNFEQVIEDDDDDATAAASTTASSASAGATPTTSVPATSGSGSSSAATVASFAIATSEHQRESAMLQAALLAAVARAITVSKTNATPVSSVMLNEHAPPATRVSNGSFAAPRINNGSFSNNASFALLPASSHGGCTTGLSNCCPPEHVNSVAWLLPDSIVAPAVTPACASCCMQRPLY